MHTNAHESLNQIVEATVGAAYEVSNVLGCGFLEKVYERALTRELILRGLRVESQVSFPISYKQQSVGEYLADLLVEDQLLVELKCADCFSNEHSLNASIT
jgi:GxxExxY protein